MDQIAELLSAQAGVVARRQLFEAGMTSDDLARAVRREELSPLLRGVYLHRTGPPTWHQRSWAAVLYAWPAALTHSSALRAAEGPGRRDQDESTIEVLVDSRRHLMGQPGLRIIRSRGFDRRVLWSTGPPRTSCAEATLDLATEAPDRATVLTALLDACGGRRTTAARLLVCAEARTQLSDRGWISAVLADLAHGTCVVLEDGYRHLVQRPHGLPDGAPAAFGPQGVFGGQSDIEHAAYGLTVSLDGRARPGATAAAGAGAARATEGRLLPALGYHDVFDDPCGTAARVGEVLSRCGWSGQTRQCPQCRKRQVA